MRYKFLFLIVLTILFISCKSTKVFSLKMNNVYIHENQYSKYEIILLNDSLLRISQYFNCEKLNDSLKYKEILVKYNVVEKFKINKKQTNELNEARGYILKLTNLTEKNLEYPIVENDEICSFLNYLNRIDRVNFESRKIFSPYDKTNIINFKEGFMSFRTSDSTIIFSLKEFKGTLLHN